MSVTSFSSNEIASICLVLFLSFTHAHVSSVEAIDKEYQFPFAHPAVNWLDSKAQIHVLYLRQFKGFVHFAFALSVAELGKKSQAHLPVQSCAFYSP